MTEIDAYTLAALVYDELHKIGLAQTVPPLALNGMERPWEKRSEETQEAWEAAVKRALVRMGIAEGHPGFEGYVMRIPKIHSESLQIPKCLDALNEKK